MHDDSNKLDAEQPAIILKALDEYGPQLDWTKHWVEYPIGTKLYAAPQASEAVRVAALEEAIHALWLMRSRPEFEPDESDKLLDRAMAAIRALSAQPGAQKEQSDAN